MKSPTIVIIASALLFTGCIQAIAINTVGGIIDNGFEALTEEQDLDFAGKALPANLKLLEVMLKSDPDNERILLLLSQGYSSYALGFVEDTDPDRAKILYLRGRDFALRLLRKDARMSAALDGSLDDLNAVLARRGKDDVPAIFWAAFGWGSYVYLSLTEPAAIADLPRTEAMMQFVVAKDPAFYYGGAHVFLGTLYGSRPRLLGGDVEKSRQHFDAAMQISGGKFLMTQVYCARSLAVQTMDEQLFDELLGAVNSTSLEVLPEFRLANAIAKRKAGLLAARKDELF